MAIGTQTKQCKVCGKDVSQMKRTKDVAGNYYCEPCVQAARQRQQATGEPAASKTCENCGAAVGALQQLWEWKGHQVCAICRDSLKLDEEQRQEEAQRQAEAEAQQARQQQEQAAQARVASEAERNARLSALRQAVGALSAAPFILLAGVVVAFIPEDPSSRSGDPKWVGVLSCIVGAVALGGMGAYKWMVYRRLAAGNGQSALVPDLIAALGRLGMGALLVVSALLMLALPFVAAWMGVMLCDMVFDSGSIINLVGLVGGFIVGGVVSLFLFVYVRDVERGRCPNCGRVFKSIIERSDFLGQQVHTVRTTENVQVRDGLNKYGPVVANVQVPTEKTVVTNHYARHRLCRACGHRWTTN